MALFTATKARLFAVSAALALTALASPARAQYPDHTIRIVSPAPPGGSPDIMSHLLQPGMTELLKQTVIIDAKGGAGGYIGSDFVAKAPADGYTLLLGGAFTANTALLQKSPAYDARRDLVPVAIFSSVPNILVAGPRLKANSVAELVAEAKANPGKLNMGSNGVGTTLHLSQELFKLRTGTQITHVAYRGWSECVVGVLSGEVDMMFDNLNTALPNITAKKLRPLALAATTRNKALPDTPTLGELGVPNAEVTSWFGIMVPGATPRAVIDRLAAAFKVIAAGDDFRRLVEQQGMDVAYYGPDEARRFWLDEIDKWEGIIKTSGIEKQ
jgi:tripartite-type tricarboxylate transporter receptor subunit TctC